MFLWQLKLEVEKPVHFVCLFCKLSGKQSKIWKVENCQKHLLDPLRAHVNYYCCLILSLSLHYNYIFSLIRLQHFTLTAAAWALSVYDRGSSVVVSPDGLRCQSKDFKEWFGCRANKGVSGRGKFYFETTIVDEGLCRVGWSTAQVL